MNFTQQKTLLVTGQGGYSVRATARRRKLAVALRNTTKRHFEVSRHEAIVR